MFDQLLEKVQSYNNDLNKVGLEFAYGFAQKHFERIGGDFEHSLGVIKKLLPMRPDDDTLIAALLHDLYVSHNVDDAKVKELFGQGVTGMLNGLRHLSKLSYAQNDRKSQLEILRKMFVTMAKDLRVILIWLACRLYALEHIEKSTGHAEIMDISLETMQIYVPIASRLGIYRMKIELEDLAFKYLNPEEYSVVNMQIEKYGKLKKGAIDLMCRRLKEFLYSKNVEAKVYGRLKSVYSTYRKLQKKHINAVEELFDFFAIRVVLPCGEGALDKLYGVLGLIHSEWRPLSSRFKDYVAVPKANGYRSLHTVVLGLAPKDMDQPVEIQIRDMEMHREAEYGIASHWIYKSSPKYNAKKVGTQVDWLKGLEKLQEIFSSESDVLKGVEVDIFKDRIFVLTPRGEVKDLPAMASPVDFAYAVHTDIGHHCVMAKVNGVLVPLDHELKNGDVVEIITRPDAAPKLKWISLAKSNFARTKIKSWFTGLNREAHVKAGRDLLNAQLERLHKPPMDANYSILKNYCGRNLTLVQRDRLVEEVGKGSQIAREIIRKIYPYERVLSTRIFDAVSNEPVSEKDVIVGGEEGLVLRFAACCSPRKGENIVGYVTRGNRVSIHCEGCHLLENLDAERILRAWWKNLKQELTRVGIRLTVTSRTALIPSITAIINCAGVEVVDLKINYDADGAYINSFLLDFDDLDKFDGLMDKLENVDGVLRVSRQDDF
ncbi:bifunctional (p)ppGpp synthetase/guanosine-3',5'-bis(diphosphate) 3'-pyrophosphohydrolase [Candidatus Peregrinibacteria bacterium]|nr:bifunctional (p)ppGpp synthetase/guanosine-3',5'-bis(diphosphate) 3'-pyrophosphohydrolase [Candidatus Peregrinibacteria bacterium]